MRHIATSLWVLLIASVVMLLSVAAGYACDFERTVYNKSNATGANGIVTVVVVKGFSEEKETRRVLATGQSWKYCHSENHTLKLYIAGEIIGEFALITDKAPPYPETPFLFWEWPNFFKRDTVKPFDANTKHVKVNSPADGDAIVFRGLHQPEEFDLKLTALLPGGAVDVPYGPQALLATGGLGTDGYSFSLESGELPPGLVLSDTALIGTPARPGTYQFAIKATDNKLNALGVVVWGVRSYSITVFPPVKLTLVPPGLSDGKIGDAYGPVPLTVIGGDSPHKFEVLAGSLPPGLALSDAGVLGGNPRKSGSYQFSVRATGAQYNQVENRYSITIAEAQCPTGMEFDFKSYSCVCEKDLLAWTAGVGEGCAPYLERFAACPEALGYRQQYQECGGACYTGSLLGDFACGYNCTAEYVPKQKEAEKACIKRELDMPKVQTKPTPVAENDNSIAQADSTDRPATKAIGGPAPQAASSTGPKSSNFCPAERVQEDGSCPDPETDPNLGDDGGGGGGGGVTDIADAGPITLLPESLADGYFDRPYPAKTLEVSGGAGGPYSCEAWQGKGLELSQTCVVSGTPTELGPVTFTAKATDLPGTTPGERQYTVNVVEPQRQTAPQAASSTGPKSSNFCPAEQLQEDGSCEVAPVIITLSPPTGFDDGTVGEAYSKTVTASGGTGPYLFLVSGNLPPGLKQLESEEFLTDAVTVAGVPTAGRDKPYRLCLAAVDQSSIASKPYCYNIKIIGAESTPEPPPDVATLACPAEADGTSPGMAVKATGGTGPYFFMAAAKSPPGLSITLDGGLIFEPGAARGSRVKFAVMAVDKAGVMTEPLECSIDVPCKSPAYKLQGACECPTGLDMQDDGSCMEPVEIKLSPPELPGGNEGETYEPQTLTADGGTEPYTFAISNVDFGLNLSPGGVLSGTPSKSGTYDFTVTATDSNNRTGPKAYSILIAAAEDKCAAPNTWKHEDSAICQCKPGTVRISETDEGQGCRPCPEGTKAFGQIECKSTDPEPPLTPKTPEKPKPPKELVCDIQRELEKQRCAPGVIDCIWGGNSRRAAQRFEQHAKVTIGTEPSARMLSILRSKPSPVCPLPPVACNKGWAQVQTMTPTTGLRFDAKGKGNRRIFCATCAKGFRRAENKGNGKWAEVKDTRGNPLFYCVQNVEKTPENKPETKATPRCETGYSEWRNGDFNELKLYLQTNGGGAWVSATGASNLYCYKVNGPPAPKPLPKPKPVPDNCPGRVAASLVCALANGTFSERDCACYGGGGGTGGGGGGGGGGVDQCAVQCANSDDFQYCVGECRQ